LVTVNDNDEKIKNFNSWRDSVIAKYSTQIFELEKANMEQSTSQLNTELENLSNKLKDKENEIDTDRNKLKNQINEACNERDLAVKESIVLRNKLTDLLHQKQEVETNNTVQIQSKENK